MRSGGHLRQEPVDCPQILLALSFAVVPFDGDRLRKVHHDDKVQAVCGESAMRQQKEHAHGHCNHK